MIFAGPVGLIQCRRTGIISLLRCMSMCKIGPPSSASCYCTNYYSTKDVMKMVYKHPGHKKLFALTVKNHYEVGGGGGNSHGLCIRWIDRP